MSWREFSDSSVIRRGEDPFQIRSGRFGESGLSSVYRPAWSEDVFISDNKLRETVGHGFDRRLLIIALVLILSCFALLFARASFLQLREGEYYRAMAEGNRIRNARIEPRRGVIYDRHGRPLVRNTASFKLFLVPADLPKDEQTFEKLWQRLSELVPADDLAAASESLSLIGRTSLESYRPLIVSDRLDYEKALLLYLESADWSGVSLTDSTRREYLYEGLPFWVDEEKQLASSYLSLAHIIGYTGKISPDELTAAGKDYQAIDYIGKMGVEYFWESELKGIAGKKQIEVDALGKEKKIIGERPAHDGNNLVLSIDLEAQLKLEEILVKTLHSTHTRKASAIALDPRDGSIVAMVSLPSFDNNLFARGISTSDYRILLEHEDKPLFNRAVSGEFPSGSTIKPVMAAAALEDGVVDENTSFTSTGGLQIGIWRFPDWKAGGHGRTDVRKAIAESVNTFFYEVGGGYKDFSGLGVDRIVYYLKQFGLGEQTGIDLAGEVDGFVPTKEWKEETKKESWYIGDTYHLAIGQGDLLVTPLQVAQFTAYFANNGRTYRPHFMKAVLTGDDKSAKELKSELIHEALVKDYNTRIVREGMRQTVTSGAARSLGDLPVAVAGKTGTAQWSSKKDPHAWFTGFAPYDNPELVITILIEEGKEGSSVATPVAKEFLAWYFRDRKK